MQYDAEHYNGDKSTERDNDALGQENARLHAENERLKKQVESLRTDLNDQLRGGVNPCYSAALDEIYFLRRALAYERIYQRSYFDYLTLPKGVRKRIDVAMARIRLALTESPLTAYDDVRETEWDWAIKASGMPQVLTRWTWEDEVAERMKTSGA